MFENCEVESLEDSGCPQNWYEECERGEAMTRDSVARSEIEIVERIERGGSAEVDRSSIRILVLICEAIGGDEIGGRRWIVEQVVVVSLYRECWKKNKKS